MANPFLNKSFLMDRDVATAILLDKAIVTDIGKAVAYTDGKQVFVNTDDNLLNILPAYDIRMLKWILWHEKYHMELKHHNRFFKYLSELKAEETYDEFRVTKEEVNIIMDILVHDSLSTLFPELVDTAMNNLAQMRNRNSLEYTFKTKTLEEMLDEYRLFKHPPEETEDGEETDEGEDGKETTGDGDGSTGESESEPDDTKEDKKPTDKKSDKTPPKEETETDDKSKTKPKKPTESVAETGTPEESNKEKPADEEEIPSEHDRTDWSKLEDIDSKEFITKEESETIMSAVTRLKAKQFKLAKLTETLNGLVTTSRRRSYSMPSPIQLTGGVMLKGSRPGRAQLYLVFDASGSMGYEMETFKEIISKTIPQAMDTPCEWFAGHCSGDVVPYKKIHGDGYYKAKFKDFMKVYANNGFNDDGDRTIELCWKAEQLGMTPIGVTDGGGQISWSKDMLKQLKRTVLVGQNPDWLKRAKEINPNIQTLDI